MAANLDENFVIGCVRKQAWEKTLFHSKAIEIVRQKSLSLALKTWQPFFLDGRG